MLGGGAVDWYQDGGIFNAVNASWPIVTEHDKRYDENDQQITPLDPENLVDIHTSQALKTIMSADAQDLAENKAKLFIEGNTAKYGGGIGANGGIIVEKMIRLIYRSKKSGTMPRLPERRIRSRFA